MGKTIDLSDLVKGNLPLLFVCLVSTRGKTGVLLSSEKIVVRVGGIFALILCPGAVREMNDMVK